MDIRDILKTRALHDAILVLDARVTELEKLATKPDPEPPQEPVTEEEEETENG